MTAEQLEQGRKPNAPKGYIEASISQRADHQKGEQYPFVTVRVEGSDRLPGSIIDLPPGQTDRYRAKAPWVLPDRIIRGESGEIEIRASFAFRSRSLSVKTAVSEILITVVDNRR